MATRKKSSGRKKAARAGKGGRRRGAAKRGAGKRGGAARKRGAAKRSRAAMKRAGGAKRGRKRTASARKTGGGSPVARVKRVTQEVVQQAAGAVTSGMETLRDIGGNIMDRVRNEGNNNNP